MIYISVQPDINYFHWQVELYLFNFIKVGIDPKNIHVVFLTQSSNPSEEVLYLQNKYREVQFFFYENNRADKSYIPSIKPWGMFKHYLMNSYLKNERVFYHDSDIIFRKKIDENVFVEDKCYLSNTISYVGYDYCVSKGVEQLNRMAEIVGIDVDVIQKNQFNSGGAQYILQIQTPEFWYKVYDDSNLLYRFLDQESKKAPNDESLIQKWCAEMWATLWNLWLSGYETEIHSELDFCFATAPIKDWFSSKILHNAGVIKDSKGMFFKGGAINRIPYWDDFSYIDDSYCSSMYVENIKAFGETLKNS